jgi:GNAT superfamily N-acetyltransferase
VYVGDGFVDQGDGYVRELVDAPRRAREAEVWVAVAGGHVLGTVTFCPVGSPYREIGRDDEGEFRMLAVSPAARGRGVGRALVELCLGRARELGYAGIRMSTMDRMTSAHRVYARLGFTRAPQDDWSPTPGVSLLAYTAPLVPPD